MAKYEKIAANIRSRIMGGELAPGEKLPTEADLAREHAVAMGTVRSALAALETEGLVNKVHGTGTFVRVPIARSIRTSERYAWEKARVHTSEDERRRAGPTEHDTGLIVDDLEFAARYGTAKASAELAAHFDVQLGTKLLERVYSTRQKGARVPFGTATSYLLYETAAGNPALLEDQNEPWPGATLHQLATIGIEVDRIVDTVTARVPTVDEAEHLDVSPGDPLICIQKVSISTEGAVVEVAYLISPASRQELRYTVELPRWSR
ncbi:MAG: GntR family transcriptional regulator [Nocardioides sp.]